MVVAEMVVAEVVVTIETKKVTRPNSDPLKK